MSGLRFESISVIKPDGKKLSGDIKWLCKCDCGNECYSTSSDLRRGHKTSCGCKTLEKRIAANIKHGQSSRKKTKPTSIEGITKTLVEWSEIYGIKRQTIMSRINRGWTPERALTQQP
jgi:hypothetical protein